MRNELRNYIKEITPISDRLMAITLNYSVKIHIISAYAPTAATDEEAKENPVLVMIDEKTGEEYARATGRRALGTRAIWIGSYETWLMSSGRGGIHENHKGM